MRPGHVDRCQRLRTAIRDLGGIAFELEQALQGIGRVAVVVHHQHLQRLVRVGGRVAAGGVRDVAGAGRQGDDEAAAPPGAVAAGIDAATVQLGKLARQAQADAQAAGHFARHRASLFEHGKDARDGVRFDADAIVFDDHLQLALRLACRDMNMPAIRRELHGI